jgi:hypothetical protein
LLGTRVEVDTGETRDISVETLLVAVLLKDEIDGACQGAQGRTREEDVPIPEERHVRATIRYVSKLRSCGAKKVEKRKPAGIDGVFDEFLLHAYTPRRTYLEPLENVEDGPEREPLCTAGLYAGGLQINVVTQKRMIRA